MLKNWGGRVVFYDRMQGQHLTPCQHWLKLDTIKQRPPHSKLLKLTQKNNVSKAMGRYLSFTLYLPPMAFSCASCPRAAQKIKGHPGRGHTGTIWSNASIMHLVQTSIRASAELLTKSSGKALSSLWNSTGSIKCLEQADPTGHLSPSTWIGKHKEIQNYRL